MSDLPSRELLKEIVPELIIEEGTEIKVFKSEFNGECLRVSDGLRIFTINIHELAHKNCKGWALEQGYALSSGVADHITKIRFCTITNDCHDTYKTFNEDTEEEAIFKACKWILEQD